MALFQTREESGVLTVSLDNPVALNDFRSNTFREELYDLLQGRVEPRVVVDLSAVDYLSSSGIAVLVGLKRRVEQQNGKLVLCRAQPLVCDLLRVMRLNQYFTFAADEAEAQGLLRPARTA